MYKTDNWINEGSGRIFESIDGDYVNISAYSPLVGNTYIELPDELKNQVKGLINIKIMIISVFCGVILDISI